MEIAVVLLNACDDRSCWGGVEIGNGVSISALARSYHRGVAWTYIVRSGDLLDFRRCRRAWDLGAHARQAYAPRSRSPVADFDRAIHEALAVYYFPAMGDWKRSIVRPLAIKGFERRMLQGWTGQGSGTGNVAGTEGDHRGGAVSEERLEGGRALLSRYFSWAEAVDDFDSLLVDHDIWAPVPHPYRPGEDLGTPDGRPIRYLGRIDQLMADPDDEYWIVTHHLVEGRWSNEHELVNDPVALADSWAMQTDFPQLLIAGSVVNELWADRAIESTEAPALEEDEWDMSRPRHLNSRRSPMTPEAALAFQEAADAAKMSHIELREQQGGFRRTVIRHSQAAFARAGAAVGTDVMEMQGLGLSVSPEFSDEHCPACPFRGPCDAMETGVDWRAVLEKDYFRREEDWDERSLRRPPGASGGRSTVSGKTANLRWG